VKDSIAQAGEPAPAAGVTGGLTVTGRVADSEDGMNGFGVGLSVALGAGIGAWLALPGVLPEDLLMGMLWWGMIVGFIFHLYQLALHGAHLPFRRR